MTPPSTPRHRYLSRDERLQARTLRDAGHPYRFIASFLSCTERQVGLAVNSYRVTPKKRKGRPQLLSEAQIDQLVAFITSSREGRQASFLHLAKVAFPQWEVGEDTIRRALRAKGYFRRIARAKPPLSDANRKI